MKKKTFYVKNAKPLIAYMIITPVILTIMIINLVLPYFTRYITLKNSRPVAATDVNLSDLTTDQHYILDPATVVDGYCYTGDTEDDAENYSYVILFRTGSDQVAAASLTITTDDAIWDRCTEYLNNSSMGVGDLEFLLYGYATDIPAESDQNSFYTEALGDFRTYGFSFARTDLDFHYLGSSQNEYQEEVDRQLHNLTLLLIFYGAGTMFMIASCVYIIVTMIRKIKTAKKTAKENSDPISGTPEIRSSIRR